MHSPALTPSTITPNRSHRPQQRRRTLLALLGSIALGTGLAACSDDGFGDPPPQFGYVLNDEIVTTNAGSALGVTTDAAKVSARLYLGAFIVGPQGQLLPNADLVTVNRSTEDPASFDYTINEKVSFSDGRPVVCEDFFLAQQAGQHGAEFGSDMPLFNQVAGLDCAPGAKQFRVTFKPGFGSRYKELFSAGTVLPSHTVADKAGISNLIDVFDSQDEEALGKLGTAWQEVFQVDKTDPATVPTSGPYRVGSKGERGDLVLETNPEWHGDPARQSPIHMWPVGSDVRQLAADNQLVVADLKVTDSPAALGLDAPKFAPVPVSSTRVDTLLLSHEGVFAEAPARQAFDRCIDRGKLAATLGKATGTSVTATGLRIVPPAHPLAPQLKDIDATNQTVDLVAARDALDGQTVRIGYLETSSWYDNLVKALAVQCQQAGVTVEAKPLDAEELGVLGRDYDALLNTRSSFGRNSATDVGDSAELADLRRAEGELEAGAQTIALTTEPRQILVERHVADVVDNAAEGGVSWNMDRWEQHEQPITTAPEGSPSERKTNA